MTRNEALNLVQATRDRFEKTREIQWKMNVAIWTLIAAAIYLFAKEPDIRFKDKGGLIGLSILFAVTHVLFVYIIQRSLETSKLIERHVFFKLNEKESTLQQFEVDIKEITNFWLLSLPGWFWFFFQVSSTSLLLTIFVLINK